MVETADRTPDDASRATDGRRFEVFVRDEEADPLRHVGTVAASTPDAAHEEASKLFAWYARDVWVCPAEEVHRYSAASLADDDERDAAAESTESPVGGEESGEPRVYEETEGTPDASAGASSATEGRR